jgi:hypothetical protein
MSSATDTILAALAGIAAACSFGVGVALPAITNGIPMIRTTLARASAGRRTWYIGGACPHPAGPVG